MDLKHDPDKDATIYGGLQHQSQSLVGVSVDMSHTKSSFSQWGEQSDANTDEMLL